MLSTLSGSVCLDSAPLIYFLEGDQARAPVVRSLLERAARGDLRLVVSAVTEAELLVGAVREGRPDPVPALLDGPYGISVVDVTRPIARRAAEYRARIGLRLVDAVTAATAAESGCSALVGNDTTFRRLTEVPYVHVDDEAST